jgi:hypothetical protein
VIDRRAKPAYSSQLLTGRAHPIELTLLWINIATFSAMQQQVGSKNWTLHGRISALASIDKMVAVS